MSKRTLIFMGTPDFAVPAAEALRQAGHRIAAAYSQPARKSGRGHKITHSPVAQWAMQHNIPVETPVSLKKTEIQQKFAAYKADVAVVAAYGLLLPQAILDIPKMGCLNIHASLLPRWRGAAPIHHAIWAGDQKTGICIMQMDKGLDTGDVLSRAEIPILPADTTSILHDRLAALGATEIVQVLEKPLVPVPQASDGVTYAHKVDKQQGQLDFRQSAVKVEQHIRAFTQWPGAWFSYKGEKIKVLAAEVVKSPSKQKPGTIIDVPLTVNCSKESIKLTILQRPGGKPLPAKSFLNGYQGAFSLGENLS